MDLVVADESAGEGYEGFVPMVLRFGDLCVAIYPHDHRPAHVHVWEDGGEAVFFLNRPDGPPEPREARGFDRGDWGE